MKPLPIGRDELKALSAALRGINFFADLTNRDLEHVFAITNLYRYDSRRTVVFRKDAVADALYIIHQGTVDILLPRFILPDRRVARLGPGDVFGEMALIDHKLRSATAVAHGPAQLFVILKPHFEQIHRENPAFAATIKRLATARAFEDKERFGS